MTCRACGGNGIVQVKTRPASFPVTVEGMVKCGACGGSGTVTTTHRVYPSNPTYFLSPEEHNRALMETAIRAVMQLQERWCTGKPPCASQSDEQELAFVEMTLRRIHREMPI